ncbi:ATP-binding protein [Ideonella dechloratans]|uniref:ATP-binding protein n=1 Tax=Ideonella dechloratans TaxID=36863 RepID=UPI0035B167F6
MSRPDAAGAARGWRWAGPWWPRTLYGRLLGVLLIGLVAGQGLSLWINLAERDRVVQRSTGLQPARRVADLVLLLDTLDAAERQRFVRLMDAPPLRVRLLEAPEPLQAPGPAATAAPETALALYRQGLRQGLGDGRPFELAAWQITPPQRPGSLADGPASPPPPPSAASPADPRAAWRAQRAERWRHHAGLVFVAQVPLQGGQWLRLENRPLADDTSLPWRVPVSLLVLALTVAALSWWAVRRVTRPLADLARAADGLGQDLTQAPLPETGPQEVARANRAFNRMQQRLRRTLEGRTRMLAAVSHDLKTPLTRMRLRAEMLDDEDLRERMEHDLDEMSQMVGDALDHLRGLEQAQERRPVDVMALLESLQADQQAMGRDVRLEGACERPWLGGAAALRRCVNNLVDNAVLYGQRALLSVQDSPEAVTIRVRDAGPGLPPEALEQVFEPFFRLEASRNRVTGGTGLGLAIARQIAEGAGGTLSLRNPPEGGLEATLRLPR